MTTANLTEIKDFIKQGILIERLEIDVDSADAIADDAGLFADTGLGLDSVESLEVMSALEGKYGIRFKNYPDELVRGAFVTVVSVATLVEGILTAQIAAKA